VVTQRSEPGERPNSRRVPEPVILNAATARAWMVALADGGLPRPTSLPRSPKAKLTEVNRPPTRSLRTSPSQLAPLSPKAANLSRLWDARALYFGLEVCGESIGANTV
jgi:hypothetical protein